MRFYDAFGLEPALSLDADELKKRFYERSKQWHPDRFGRAGAREQEKALEMTAVLNDAFRTLRDPVARAEYFLQEKGAGWAKAAPIKELLNEVFELNMALEELRDGDDSVRPQLMEARERFIGMQAQVDQSLTDAFSRYDASKDEAILVEISTVLHRRNYIRNLIRDVENVLPN